MDKAEQIGSTHECFSDLLHAIGAKVLVAIACNAMGISINERANACYQNPRIEIFGLSRAAKSFVVDLVYTLESGQRVVEVWIFEIQLSWSAIKRRRWALFLSAYENEYDVDGHLVVFSPDPELHERIRTKALPGCRATPLLLDRDHFERITDADEARRRPRLAVLGCLFHAQEPAPLTDQLAVFRAAWLAIQGLPPREAQRYGVLVMDVVAKTVVNRGIEQLREDGELDEELRELVSDTARKATPSTSVGKKVGKKVEKKLSALSSELRSTTCWRFAASLSRSSNAGASWLVSRSRPSSAGTRRPRPRPPTSRSMSCSPTRADHQIFAPVSRDP